MQFFKRLTDPALKRLYKFVLKRLIGRFLAEDELDLDQLDVHLGAGRLELCDLHLNADIINDQVLEGLPFRMKKGYVGSVRLTLSYTSIMSESCVIELDDIDIVLVPVTDYQENTSVQSSCKPPMKEKPMEPMDEVSQEGLDFVASWIEQVTSKIKVTVSNISLRFETETTPPVALVCKLEYAQFIDESPSDVANVDRDESMAASTMFGRSQKGIKFHGIRMELAVPSDDLYRQQDGKDVVVHPFLLSDSQCYVQVKVSHYDLLDAPAMDVDLFLHSLRIVLQPQHFISFGRLMDAFSMETLAPPPPRKENVMYQSICDARSKWLKEDEKDASDKTGGIELSIREFQRIEQLLQEYHRTHTDLKHAAQERANSTFLTADFPYPLAAGERRLSIAESVESAGLSDLEDEEFYDAGGGSVSDNVHFGSTSMMMGHSMAQSMYASALFEQDGVKEQEASRRSQRSSVRTTLRNRFKVHLLECDVIILYDDLPDLDEEGTERKPTLPLITDQERLEVICRDMMCSTLSYTTHISLSFTIGSFEIQEKILARMSMDVARGSSATMLTTTIISFSDTSPITKRKVHLSANLSAQVRLDLNPLTGVTTLLAIQISTQPILLEWEMYILDRAHRLIKLMEESSAAREKKAVALANTMPKGLVYPKKLDINSECVEITLRFPMVQSDMIRFGPSSKRGLSEDKLVLTLEGVKAFSYADCEPVETEAKETTENLPWLAEFAIRFDRVTATLTGPLGWNQRTETIQNHVLFIGQSDALSVESCCLTLRTQTPTVEQIRKALHAKSAITQDSLEQMELNGNVPRTTSMMDIDSEHTTGDDNDGGRVGSNGWSQDARARVHSFEQAASRACLMNMNIIIPQSTITFPKQVLDRLMILFDALLAINPIDINGHNQRMSSATYRNRMIPSYMSVNVSLLDGTLALLPCQVPDAEESWFTYHLAFQDLHIFQVSQWMGQLISRVHVSCQNVSLLEEEINTNRRVSIKPVLYKNPIGISNAPMVFVGIDILDQTQDMREMKVELHGSTVTMRYDVTSNWPVHVSDIFSLEYPPPIISLDSASTSESEYLDLLEQVKIKAYEVIKLAVAPKTIFTKLFVSFYDAVLDYAPRMESARVIPSSLVSLTSPRMMLVFGNASVSSNVVSGAMIQGYKVMIRDVQLYLTPEGPTYEEVDAHLLGKEMFHETKCLTSRGQLTTLYPSFFMFLEKYGFLKMITMDVIDVFLRAIVPIEPSKVGTPEAELYTPAALGSPELSVEITLGTANIFACFDSFNTLIDLMTLWSDQLNIEGGEPHDTTAYVGLDRVKDVSVVTNLGPSNQRHGFGTCADDTESLTSRPRRSSSGRSLRGRGGSMSSTLCDVEEKGIEVMSQIETNAFGAKLYSGAKHVVSTDTEARLLRTRLDEIEKEKERMVQDVQDDSLSATELRQKYKAHEKDKPRLRINELVIEDYVGQRDQTTWNNTISAPGAFLLSGDGSELSTSAPASDNPWFASSPPVNNHMESRPSSVNGSPELHPIGSFPDEQAARWLPSGRAPTDDPSSFSPHFDPVDEETLTRELSLLNELSVNHEANKEISSVRMNDSNKNWWGTTRAREDVEMSELQTEETSSVFSHQTHCMDDEESHLPTLHEQDTAPMSMSMMITGTGEDAGTEVEMDFTLDQEMQLNFDRLMQDQDEVGDGFDAYDSDEREDIPPLQIQAPQRTNSISSIPISIPLSRSNSKTSCASDAPAPPTLSPPDEPTARWFYDDLNTREREGPPSRIYPHHVEIPIGGSAASLSFGERECEEAIRSIARENAARKQSTTSPIVIRHILLRDFNICMRFFGGSDWSQGNVKAPSLKHHGVRKIPEPVVRLVDQEKGLKKTEKLLDALLDNYVPTVTGTDLFGADKITFSGSKSAPASSHVHSQSSSRKRSLKSSGRKTEEMLELVITRIQLRMDVFKEDDTQPLASNTVIGLGDIEILDYISTSQIRKIICYWKSDVIHPRENGRSMVHIHLMTIRPGPNLCPEHRLKMKLLPLRVNLDQEVVNFLRQFVPTDDFIHSKTLHEGEEQHEMEGTELSTLSSLSVRETDVHLGEWFFQNIDIRPCKIKIDYRPNHVNFQALRSGDYLEVINLFVLEGMELTLHRVKASGIDGWNEVGEHVLMSWVNDITRHQIHKCVASVSIPPLRSFANIGSGAADLILLPMEHYGKDRRVVRGIKKGAKSFLKSVTIETLNTASKLAQGTQALLEHADDVVSSTSSRSRKMKYRQPGSRIARNSKRMGGGGIRSALNDHGGIGSRQYLAQQPSNATEGFYQAYDSISRELHTVAKTIVAVPLVEYKKTGSQGYVRSVIRAVPVAVLRPMIGATEAMSKALIGVRNAVDPELKEDVENKFKDFRTI